MSKPTTPTGQRLMYHGLPVDPPRVVSRVTPALNDILAIEREAAERMIDIVIRERMFYWFEASNDHELREELLTAYDDETV